MTRKKTFDKRKIKYFLAPVGVAVGLTIFISCAVWIAKSIRISEIGSLLPFVPRYIFFTVGILCIVIWLPIFIAGIVHLGRKGAVGQSETLRTKGVYRIVRNPMYSGASFTLIGLGLLLLKTGVVIAGILWLLICTVQCKREEKELAERFGEAYLEYKRRTPMFFPKRFF